ncbi:hypothetical protein B0T22DRAFT_472201 [Podospora appendiculata]|uniref:Family c-likeg-protein-coupled receptor protein n=1 Tax=Podospora appendiculata TaxID=314037 RepID=A0AAE0X1M4_9PEZI|nr:hypothetical protein B0T22DRAFT_472201 [Podospora appendiculata]
MAMSGPPYLPQVSMLGGTPTPIPDDPICAVLMVIFLIAAAANMYIFRTNRSRGHFFVFSALLFGFSCARAAALVFRIAWASRPTNASIAIAANIFTAAGVLLLFVINLLFTQRILRAYHPSFGWSKISYWGFGFFLFSLPALLVMLIITTIHSYYTLDVSARMTERNIQLFAGTYLAVLAFLPVPVLLAILAWPRSRTSAEIEHFGHGQMKTKIALVLFTSLILTFGAGFRIGANFATRPLGNPGWWHHKACYYCVNYVIEIIVVYTYTLVRFDRRFHVPNGSSTPGHYSGRVPVPVAGITVTEEEVIGESVKDSGDSGSGKEGSTRRDSGEKERV